MLITSIELPGNLLYCTGYDFIALDLLLTLQRVYDIYTSTVCVQFTVYKMHNTQYTVYNIDPFMAYSIWYTV